MKPSFVPAAVALTALAFAVPAQAQGAGRGDTTAPHFSPFTPADVQFMSGMIYHHAQAVMMAGWAPTHDASPSLRALCERIVVGQTDEINLMQRWLRDRHLNVPDPKAVQSMMPGMAGMAGMPGMDSSMMMPGMLTTEQLAELDKARGPDFDRLFLQFMIQHHRGAITMVNQLFGIGSGEEEVVFKFASDVYADQTTEIDRMQRMLASMLFGVHGQ
jgi:uncharacterized protein (DUF305 family)